VIGDQIIELDLARNQMGLGDPERSGGEGPRRPDASRTRGWVANPGEALDSRDGGREKAK
jgi:hypothetical protein